MFGNLFGMFDNYEDRKVDRYEEGNLLVDTCSVTDAAQPYETAVAHPNYNGGDIVIVECYDTKQEAQDGHNRWVAIMTTFPLPVKLLDVSSAAIAALIDMFHDDDDNWREFPAGSE